jgi:hypothetical protein
MTTAQPVIKLYERGTPESYRQDAHLAMGTKVENAVVELLTNADDSYERLEQRGGPAEGRIRIEIEHRRRGPSRIRVADRAEGLGRVEMEKCFTRPGANTSGRSSGSNVRGSLGRGAKDVPCFGGARFESVKDDRYACLEIDDRGEGRFQPDNRGRTSVRCTPEIRRRLGIPGGKNGTVVTVSVKTNFSVRQFRWWHETFRKHFQLRDVLADPHRRVEIVDASSRRSEKLRYRYPEGKVVREKTLEVPDYPDAKPRLIIREHLQGGRPGHLDEDKFTPYWEAGILVKGRKAIFENTFFDRALSHDVESSRYFGELQCPEIDQLINEYEECQRRRRDPPASNPVSILKRDRSGLHPDHPFVASLYAVAADELRAVIAARRPTGGDSVASDETSRRFESLARAAERFLAEKAEETEDEVGSGLLGLGLPPGLYLIPSSLPLCPRASAVMSLLSVGKPLEELDSPVVSLCPSEGLEYEVGQWVETGEEANRHSLRLRFRASEVVGTWEVDISVAGTRLGGRVRVALPEIPEPPQRLEFEHKSYGLRVGKPKAVRLVAPVADDQGPAAVSIVSDNPDVIVKGGGRIELHRVENPPRMEGVAEVVCGRAGAAATLTASLNGQLARAKVAADRGAGPKILFGLTARTKGNNRSWWETLDTERGAVRQLWITVRDKSVGRYLGRPAGGKWPGQDTVHFRILEAEIIGEEVAREHLLNQSVRSPDAAQRHVAEVLFEIQKLKAEFLPIAHRHLIPQSEIVL